MAAASGGVLPKFQTECPQDKKTGRAEGGRGMESPINFICSVDDATAALAGTRSEQNRQHGATVMGNARAKPFWRRHRRQFSFDEKNLFGHQQSPWKKQ